MLKNFFNRIRSYIEEKTKNELNKDEYEFLPAALEVVETPPSPLGRSVLWLLFIFILIVVIWVVVGQVDEVAIAPGKIIPTGNVKIIQAEDKGVVKGIFVKDGQKVSKGELLIELDTTITAADVARIKREVAYYSLEIDRLLAEQSGSSFIPQQYPSLDPKDIAYQQNLYQTRLAEYNTKLLMAKALVMQNEADLATTKAGYKKQVELFAIAKEKEDRLMKLAQEDAIATFVVLDYQAKRIEIEEDINAQASEINRKQWNLIQAQEQLNSIVAERNKDISTSLMEDRKQLSIYSEELKKAEEKDRLSKIVAPIDGRVAQLSIHTVGGVVTEAQPLLEVVPEDAVLQVEAFVANKDIGFVSIGQSAEVKIETFNFQKFGTVDATVVEISPDAIEDKEKGRVYRVVLEIDKNSFDVNGKEVALSPGMTATGEIKIRQKRIIEFFLDPFKQYQSEALRER